MVSYSPRAAKSLAFLKQYYNDIDIFVEDTGNHNMWLHIIRSLIPQNKRISSVSLLGGRDNVVNACKLDQKISSRPRLYIIDGDFDFLLGRKKNNLEYLYRIRAYCVENLLLKESSIVPIGLESQPTITEPNLVSLLNLNSFIGDLYKSLISLFVTYSVAHEIAPQVQTVGYSVRKLLKQSSGTSILDDKKIWLRMLSVSRQVVKLSNLSRFISTRSRVLSMVNNLTPDQIISGKDYILPIVMLHFKAKCGYKQGDEHFKVAMSRNFDPRADPLLARRIRSLRS